MSARLHSKQRYRRSVPTYEFRGYTIRVYRTKNRFSAQFWNRAGKRERFEKATESDAVEAAKEAIRKLSDTEIQATILEQSSAEQILKPIGISLIEASRQIATSLEKLRPFNIGIAEAVEYYVARHQIIPITVEHLVDELIALKGRDTGIHNKRDLTSKLKNGFCKKFGTRLIASITESELTVYIDSYAGRPRTRRNQHSALVTLFNHARTHGYLPKKFPTEMVGVAKPKAGKPAKNIFTPPELQALIRGALDIHSRALGALLVQGNAGIRSEELRQTDPKKDRLRWGDVWLDQPIPEIHVRLEVSKTGEERFVPIPPDLVQWLCLLRLPDNEPVYPAFNLFGDYRNILKQVGLGWKRNGLRKAFNTYDEALSGSFRLTAQAAGNSPVILKRFYHKPTSQVGIVALQWFSLGPVMFGRAVRPSIAHIKRQDLQESAQYGTNVAPIF